MKTALRVPPAIIVLFCLWHMTAVALYLFPASDTVVGKARAWTAPYVLLLSQWQKWDIFAPEPSGRVSVFLVDRDAGDRWETVLVMDLKHLPWWAAAKELKVLSRIEGGWEALAQPYLRSLCDRIPRAPGSRLRLTARTFFVPTNMQALDRMATTQITKTDTPITTVLCPRQ